MKNVKSKIALASLILCGSVALGIGALNNGSAPVKADSTGFKVSSASLRVPDEEYSQGIRFTISLGDTQIPDGYTLGALLIPTNSLNGAGLTLGLDNADLRNCSNLTWNSTTKEAYLHLYDVPATQYAREISIRAYVDDADPETEPTYTETTSTSFAKVAEYAIQNDETLDDAQKENLLSSYLTYTVNYYDEDKTTLLETTTGVYNQKLTAYTPNDRDGYDFDGWYNKAGTQKWDFDTTTVSGTTNLYAKWTKSVDEVAQARESEPNTLLFFDKAFGVKQVTKATGNSFEYSTSKFYGNEEGSLMVTFPNSAQHNTVDFDMKGYEFNAGDYIEFYVYNDTETPTLSLMFGYSNSTQLIKGEWTRVIGSAEWIKSNNYFRFYGQAAGFGSGTNVDGSVYISKVKVFEGFEDLSTVEDGETWAIGETTFKGAPTINNNAPATQLQKTLYKTGDAVTMRLWAHGSTTSSYAGFEATLATAIDATAEDKYVSFTVKGADKDLFTVNAFGTDGKDKTGAAKACVTRTEENGFTTYVFRIKTGLTISKFRVTPLGNSRANATGNVEIIISNVTVGDYSSLRTGEDANTVFFMDVPLGPTLQQIYRKNQTNLYAAEYTTEMAYGNERGSYKSTVSCGQSESYHNMVWSQADLDFLSDTDYVVFYLYSTYSKKIFWSFNRMSANTGYEIMPNHWNRIIVSAKDLKQATWTLIDTRMYAKETGAYFDLYMSKVVRYTADQVTKLEDKGDTDTWTLGSTTFQGAPSINNGPEKNLANGSAGYESGVEYKKAYIADGVLSVTFARTNDGYINLKLAESIAVAVNTEMYVTVVMYDYGRLDELTGYLNNSGVYKLSYVSHESVGNGYAKVTLKCDAKDSDYTITSVRLDVDDHSDITMTTQFLIKDIVVSNEY